MNYYSKHIKSYRDILKEYTAEKYILTSRIKFFNQLILNNKSVNCLGLLYEYITFQEALEIEKNLLEEFDRKYVLELTAAFESKCVYFFRHGAKSRSAIKRLYNNTISGRARTGGGYLMFSHINSIFKIVIQPYDNIAYANMLRLVDYRNWIAHGRGWDKSENWEIFDVEYSMDLIKTVHDLIPTYPNSLKL